MNRKLMFGLGAGSLLAIAVLALLPISYYDKLDKPAPTGPLANLPSGEQTYSIAQAAEVWPKIVQATINPPDVHVGDTQVIEAVIESRGPVTAVYADIETDNKIVRLNLAYVGVAEAVPDRLAGFVAGREKTNTQNAFADEVIRGRYRGEWVVHDTHNTKYYTTITAEAGNDSSSVVLAWSDACGIPPGGDYTLGDKDDPCVISSADGVDNGNVTINNSLTLNANFAFNSGMQISILSNGSIALCGGCAILQTNIWQVDSDADGYPAASTMYLQDSAPTNGRRRYIQQVGIDCNDSIYNANNTCGVIATLVGHWSFDEGSGNTAGDNSEYLNYGTFDINSWPAGFSNTGMLFSNNRMTVPDSPSMQLPGDMSINFLWNVNADGSVSDSSRQWNVFKKGDLDGLQVDYHIRLQAGSRISGYGGDPSGWSFFGESKADGGWATWLSANTNTLAPYSWKMITIVREGGHGMVYQDGILLFETYGSNPSHPASSETSIFGDYMSLGNKGDGDITIDELRIYNGALSQSDIIALHNLYFGAPPPGGGDEPPDPMTPR